VSRLLLFLLIPAIINVPAFAAVVTVTDSSQISVEPNSIELKSEDFREFSPEEFRKKLESFKKRPNFPKQQPLTVHFGIETVYFQIVLGAVAIQHTWSKASAGTLHEQMQSNSISDYVRNPVALDHFLDGLVDVVGHAAFYNFMVANRFVTEWLYPPPTGKIITEMSPAELKKETRRLKMERRPYLKMMLPGLGMTAGSIASHLTGDMFNMFKQCHLEIVKRGQQNLAGVEYKTESKEQTEACQAVWHEWTSGKKFYEYAPAITSMIIATMGGGAVNWLARAAAFRKEIGANGEVNYVERLAFEKLKTMAVKQFAFTGFSLGLDLLPGGWGLKALRMIGHGGQIAIFIKFDEYIRDTIADNANNRFRSADIKGPMGLGLITRNIMPGKNFEELDEDLTGILKTNPADVWFQPDEKLTDFLKNFGESMENWREVSNRDALSAHNMWRDKVNNFITSTRLALHYYGKFINDLKGIEQKKVGIMSDLIPNDLARRIYPFYGIRFNYTAQSESYEAAVSEYLDNPDNIEKLQKTVVGTESMVFCSKIPSFKEGLYPEELNFLEKTCQGLLSSDNLRMGLALNEINKKLGLPWQAGATLSPENRSKRLKGKALTPLHFHKILTEFRNKLGDPYPLLSPMEGLSFAFDVHETVQKHRAHFELENVGPYKMEKISDYMAYKMVCGSHTPAFSIVNTDGKRVVFDPPRIALIYTKDLCFDRTVGEKIDAGIRLANIPSSYLYRHKFETARGTYHGIGDLILNNLNPEMNKIIQDKGEYLFDTWWDQNQKPEILKTLDILHKQYGPVQQRVLDNLYREDHINNVGPVSNALAVSIKQEIRVNLLLQGELLKVLVATHVHDDAYIENLVTDYVPPKNEIKQRTSIWTKIKNTLNIDFGFSAVWKTAFNGQILEALKHPLKTGKVFTFQNEVEKMMADQESLITQQIFEYNETITPDMYQKKLKALQKLYKDSFSPFEMTPYQQGILEITQANISRLLNQYQNYVELAMFLRNYDGNLTKDNVGKKPTGGNNIIRKSQ
jgi:hypothetical protein